MAYLVKCSKGHIIKGQLIIPNPHKFCNLQTKFGFWEYWIRVIYNAK